MESMPGGEAVAEFLGRADDAEFVAFCGRHVVRMYSFVFAYTRGVGFDPIEDPDMVQEDLSAVIVTATARLVTNPAQVERETADGYTAVGGFQGFTLPELKVLDRYRRRTA